MDQAKSLLQLNPKFILGTAIKEKITGFASVSMNGLKTTEMKICIANTFATYSRFALNRSDGRQSIAAVGDLTIDEDDHMNGG